MPKKYGNTAHNGKSAWLQLQHAGRRPGDLPRSAGSQQGVSRPSTGIWEIITDKDKYLDFNIFLCLQVFLRSSCSSV